MIKSLNSVNSIKEMIGKLIFLHDGLVQLLLPNKIHFELFLYCVIMR